MNLVSLADIITSRPGIADVIHRAIAAHRAAFGRPASLAGIAPGRVNLIGEHTDYTGGFVLPIAIDRWTVATLTPSADRYTRVLAADLGEQVELDTSSPLDPAHIRAAKPRWATYIAGVLEHMRLAAEHRGVGWGGPSTGRFDITIASSVPLGAGLASSAALEIAAAMALAAARRLDLDPAEIANIGRRAEHQFAGVPCGIMDQLVVSSARAGHAMLIDCATETARSVGLPADTAIITVNTGVKHELPDGAYQKKVRACERAAAALGVERLRDAGEELLGSRAASLDEEARRAATHVIAENARTLRAAQTLGAGSSGRLPAHEAVARVGWMMFESHASLRDTLQVSCKELDILVEIASLRPGVHGARMTGAGFGGSIVALVAPAAVPAFTTTIRAAFKARTGLDCTVEVVQPSEGAAAVSLS